MNTGVTNIPNINEELQTKSLSVTNAVVVNGYSQKKDIANEFAAYLTVDRAQNLYERTGRMPARKGVTFTSPPGGGFRQGIRAFRTHSQNDGDQQLLGTDGNRIYKNLVGRRRIGYTESAL